VSREPLLVHGGVRSMRVRPCFSTSRCGVQVQVQVPSPLNSHYAECLEEGVEDWKTGSLEVCKEKMILATGNCRHKDHQGADDSKIQTIKSNITSVSMSRIGLSLQPTPRLCRAVSEDFWKQRIAQAQSASAPRSRLDPIPIIRQQILGSVLTLKILRLPLSDALT
jgi:hypothetical protein